jgi:VCBS repeat-containing protein
VNFDSSTTFTYTVSDGQLSDQAQVTVTMIPINDRPLAGADSYSTNMDTQLVVNAPGVLSNDSDPEGSQLTAFVVTGPARGTLVLNSDGAFTYTPDTGLSGPDSFTYRASDGTAYSTLTTVSITVNN